MHAARGPLFETWVVSELHKKRLNAGCPPDLCFWRDSAGNDLNVFFEAGDCLTPIEIKSGCTFVRDWADGLKNCERHTHTEGQQAHLIYGAAKSFQREVMDVWSWRDVDQVIPAIWPLA